MFSIYDAKVVFSAETQKTERFVFSIETKNYIIYSPLNLTKRSGIPSQFFST